MMVAGGSGGHIYPALALADELKKRHHEIVFVGSDNRMEDQVIPQAGYPFIPMKIKANEGSLFDRLGSMISIAVNYFKIQKDLRDVDLVIGFGNYISVPVILAAKKLKIKTMIHEQNSYVGRANLFLENKVDLVIASYKESLAQFKNPHTYLIGNPRSSEAAGVKKDAEVIKELGLDPTLKHVVIFFGSLGSLSVSQVIGEYLRCFDGGYEVIYAAGSRYIADFKDLQRKGVRILEKIDAIRVMANCDLAVVRAGATTLAEITAIGIASILIPSPYVPNNHQFHNAMSLKNADAAVVIEEKDLNAALLQRTIDELMTDDRRRNRMAEDAKALGNERVIDDIIDRIDELWKQ